jgi:hypothetical protein
MQTNKNFFKDLKEGRDVEIEIVIGWKHLLTLCLALILGVSYFLLD